MLDSQTYLRCREPALAKLKDKVETILKQAMDDVDDLLENYITDDFIEPGRNAIDRAISDGEDAEQEVSSLQEKVAELETEIEELKAQLAELQP